MPDLIPVRMINQYVYCPRLFYLEWVQCEFVESHDTLEGHLKHRAVDKPAGDIPEEECWEKIHATSVDMSAPKAGLIAKMDLIESDGDELIPVDYKKGTMPGGPDNAWDTDIAQLCAQALILRENNHKCSYGIIYYIKSKKRVRIDFDQYLINKVEGYIKSLKETASSGKLPPPLDGSPKCQGCSLSGICLPDEVNMLAQHPEDKAKKEEVRRLYPARDDSFPLYVDQQGAYISKNNEEVVVKDRSKKELARFKLKDVSQICIIGNAQISTQAVVSVLNKSIPICWFSYGGWFQGITHNLSHKNVELRINQSKTAFNKKRSLQLSGEFVKGKIRNCRTFLKRNHPQLSTDTSQKLKMLAEKAGSADSSASLLGIEGAAAALYFSEFEQLIKVDQNSICSPMFFNFESRNRRPPTDPVNSLLSFAYTLLVKEFFVTLLRVGFDPYLGFYHSPKYGRPALALDMMEEFRPIVCDSIVITAINNKEIQPGDFIARAGAFNLTKEGRKKFLEAFYRRLDCLINHPVFGYKISYRRVFEVQVRLLSRYLNGEIDKYPAFTTR